MCSIVTCALLAYNQSVYCTPHGMSVVNCFYLSIDLVQVAHVVAANSILFGRHILEKFVWSTPEWSMYSVKGVFIVPLRLFRPPCSRNCFLGGLSTGHLRAECPPC